MGTNTIKPPAGFQLDVVPPKGFELDVKPPKGFELDVKPPKGFELDEQKETQFPFADPDKPLGFVEDIVPAAPGWGVTDPKDVSMRPPGKPPIGVRESIREEFTRPAKGAQYVPGVGGVVGTAENLLYLDAAQRLQNKFDYEQPIRTEQLMPGAMGIRPARYATKEKDQKLIEDLYLRMQKQQRGYTAGGKIAKGLLNLPTWMAEFAMTGGLASLGRETARQAGMKLLQRYAKTKAGQIALRGMGWTGGAITRASLGLAPRIAQEFTRRRLPEKFTVDDQGKIVDFNWPKEKPYTSFAKAWGGMVIASASEEAGRTITGIPVALLNKTKFGSKFINELRRGWISTTGGTAGDFTAKMLRKGGYSNILGEYGEEALEALLLSATGVEDFGAKEAYEKEGGSWEKLDAKNKLSKRLVAAAKEEIDPTNIGVRLAVLATPMAGRVAVGIMTGGGNTEQINKLLAEEENTVVEEIKSESPAIEEDQARQLARQHIADQIEYEKVIYDELLKRHYEGDTKATEDLNNLVQEFHLPTYEAYLNKINQASDYYADYIQEGMMGKGPVKPKSIKSFIAPKEGMKEITETPPTVGVAGPQQAIQPRTPAEGLELPQKPAAKAETPEDALWELGNAQLRISEAIKKYGFGGITESEQHPEVVQARRLIEEKSNELYDSLSPKYRIGETVSYQSYSPAGTYTVAKKMPDGTFKETPNKEQIGKPREVKIVQAKFDLAQSADNIKRIGIPTTFRLNNLETQDVKTGEKVNIYPHERVNKETLSETIQVNPTEVLKALVGKTKQRPSAVPELAQPVAKAAPAPAPAPAPAKELRGQALPERGVAELQAEIDSYLKAQKNPPTELLTEFNAAVRKKKGPKLMMGFDPHLEEFIEQDVKPTIEKAKVAGNALKEIGLAAPKLFMKVIEPAKAAEKMTGKEAYTAVIKAIHTGTDVAQMEWEDQRNEVMDMTMEQLRKWFDQFSENDNRNFLIANAGVPGSIEAETIKSEARKALPDVLKQPHLVKAIREISENNFKKLKKVADDIGWVQDYFYGIYKNPDMVDRFFKYWKTTKRFTKQKIHPSLADAINYGLEPRHNNYIDNLRAEYMGIARLGAMKWLKKELMRTGEGRYIDNMMDAPQEWRSVQDPVFKPYLVKPELAELINDLISTNKITQQPVLNAFRKIGNVLRITKFIGSIYHLRSEIQQAIADSGYLGFVHKKTALRGFQALGTSTKERWAKLRKTPEYKRLLSLGIGYRYSYEQQAQKQFKDFVEHINKGNFIGATFRGLKIPLKIPSKFTGWLFEQYIPMVKALKVLDAQMEIEKKEGRAATDWEIINIIKETQNFYGEMNERLFGRSGTVTTAMRFIYLAPGFAEGNYRTILKSLLQWGQGEAWRAGRSRSNMVNSPLITATIATLGTLMLTGKPPKKPKSLEDVRDIFKIDTGKKDKRGDRVMIDMMTYDKDYWNIYFNVLRGRPDVAVYESLRRLGGMKSPMFDMMLDFAMMSTGKAIYDWKGDRVTEITDTSLEKLMKIAIHELRKTEPIPMSVFRQARKKEAGKIISFAEAVLGLRPTISEKAKRERDILRRCWSLKGQKEEMYQSLATLDRPRAGVKWYNNKVKDVLESRLVPKSMRDEWTPKLTIDLERYLQNQALEASRLPTTKDSKEQIEKAVKLLKNFKISAEASEQLLTDYYNRPKVKKAPVTPLERDRILGRAMKKKRLKERMQ